MRHLARIALIAALTVACWPAVGDATITRVKSTGKCFTNTSNDLTCSFATLPSAGNAIVAAFWGWDGGTVPTISCSDNQGNTYTNAVTRRDATLQQWVAICRDPSIGTPSGTFTVTMSAAGPTQRNITGVAIEFTNFAAADLDQTASNAGDLGTLPGADTTATATTAQANELLIAVSGWCNAAGTWNSDIGASGSAPATGWTLEIVEAVCSPTHAGSVAYNIVSSTVAARHTWSNNPTSSRYVAAIATFMAAAAPGGDTTYFRRRLQ
jgi:hypothetical protein